MQGYGEILKRARESKNLKFQEIQKATKIDIGYLKAMEEENLETFEKPIYMKLFLKTYARYLKIDHLEVLRLFEAAPELKADPEKEKIDLEKEIITKEAVKEAARSGGDKSIAIVDFFKDGKNLPVIGIAAGVIVLAALITFFVASSQGKESTENSENVYVVPEQKSMKVTAKARSEVWMKAKYNGKEEDFLLKAGETKNWADVEKIIFLVGNAAGIEFTVNGDSIGVIGEEGEVINGLVFQTGKNWFIDKAQGFRREAPAAPAAVKPAATATANPVSKSVAAEETPVAPNEISE